MSEPILSFMADGRAAAPIAPGLDLERTVGVASYTLDPSCTYLPSSNSIVEIDDNW